MKVEGLQVKTSCARTGCDDFKDSCDNINYKNNNINEWTKTR
jgi:hypothetical protein